MDAALALEPRQAPAPAIDGRNRRAWLATVTIAWVLIFAAMVAMKLTSIATTEFHDPDDELRLVEVRDLLAGQDWFDLHQYRVDAAGGGVPMHWSRIVDVPIAAVILLLRPLVGQPAAEWAALLVVPGITLLAMLGLVGWMASRTLAPRASLLSICVLAVAAPVIIQVMPLRIDHHGWQIVLALGAVAAFLDPSERRGGALSGAALACWMAISFEGLPLSAWFIAVHALWALFDPAMRTRLVATMQSLAGTSAALFLATRGLANLAPQCDAIAPIHLAMFGWGAVAISVPAMWKPQSRMALAGGLGAAGLGALALVAIAAPQCTTGSFDMLDPVVRSFWYDNVQEGKPLWRADWHIIAQYLVPPLVGLWSALSLARRTTGLPRRWWIFQALMLAGAIGVSLMVMRSAAFACALAALPLGWRLWQWIDGLRRPDNPLLRVGELLGVAALIFATLFPVVPVMAVENLLTDKVAGGADNTATIACSTGKAGGALDALGPGDILAPLDFGPNVLLYSRKGVLATGHHRGAPAMRMVIDAFTGTPEQAREIMRRKGLRFVLICPNVQEMNLYRARAPKGFAAQMLDGKTPTWLRPIPLPTASGLRLWQIAD